MSSVSVRKRLSAACHDLAAAPVDVEEGAWRARGMRAGQHVGHRVPVTGRAADAGEAHHVGLEDGSGLVQHGQVAHVDAADVHAAAGDDGDELVTLQPLQRLADGGAAEAECGLQIVVADHGAGREFEPDDHAADVAVGPRAQRLG
jgi:hypothetical protein